MEISILSQNLHTFFPQKYLHTFSKSIYFSKKSTYFLKIYILSKNLHTFSNICFTKNLYTFSEFIYFPLFQNEVEIINLYTSQKIYILSQKIYILSQNLHTFTKSIYFLKIYILSPKSTYFLEIYILSKKIYILS